MSCLPRCVVCCALVAVISQSATAQGPTALRVRSAGIWRQWWTQSSAPAVWSRANPVLSKAVEWKPFVNGGDLAEVQISGAGEAIRLRLILVRLNPEKFRFELAAAGEAEPRTGTWNIDLAVPTAAVAINAGQFTDAGPWGWVVQRGEEVQPPGRGSLAVAIAFDSAGKVHWVEPNHMEARHVRGRVRDAFQSYPMLLKAGGVIPGSLRKKGGGVDLKHRDSRLAIGQLRDGKLLIVLTRVDLVPARLAATPFGLTVAEMAAVMGGLGSERAVLLDGGISGQLLVRDSTGLEHFWRGWRGVPLGLVITPRRE